MKLKISDDKFNLNLKFYYWLKHLVKTKLTDPQAEKLLQNLLSTNNKKDQMKILDEYISKFKPSSQKFQDYCLLISNIETKTDIEIFIFSLKLYMIKDLLLAEAKLQRIIDIQSLSSLDPLSLKYDEKLLYTPYSARVNGALLSLLFFDALENNKTNLLSNDAQEYLSNLSQDAINLKNIGIEPNQIFMLMFSESINQSITSLSGSNYEDRILATLVKIGIKKSTISKTHDQNDKSTEFDFFFEINNRTYGIGAKRTLRERYKQFIKTSLTSHIDVMIEITLGLDLNEEKAKTILNHGTKIFVADEIYQQRKFLQKLEGVYSVKDLNLKTLRKL